MRQHHKQVATWLKSKGATNIYLTPGGKHPKLCFTFQQRSYAHPISGTTSDTYRAAHNFISELRHVLGLVNQPQPELQSQLKPKEPTMLNARTEPFNAPRVLPVIQNKTKPTVSCDGTIALYSQSTREEKRQLTIRISGDMYEAFRALSPTLSRVFVTYMNDNTWTIRHDPTGNSRFVKNGTRYQAQPIHPETSAALGPFFATPAQFLLEGDTIIATLTEPPRKQSNRPEATFHRGPRAAKPQPATETTITNVTTTQAQQLTTLLEAIRRVETETDYKLTREKATSQIVFVHKNPVIR